jgi:hypothetical protein
MVYKSIKHLIFRVCDVLLHDTTPMPMFQYFSFSKDEYTLAIRNVTESKHHNHRTSPKKRPFQLVVAISYLLFPPPIMSLLDYNDVDDLQQSMDGAQSTTEVATNKNHNKRSHLLSRLPGKSEESRLRRQQRYSDPVIEGFPPCGHPDPHDVELWEQDALRARRNEERQAPVALDAQAAAAAAVSPPHIPELPNFYGATYSWGSVVLSTEPQPEAFEAVRLPIQATNFVEPWLKQHHTLGAGSLQWDASSRSVGGAPSHFGDFGNSLSLGGGLVRSPQAGPSEPPPVNCLDEAQRRAGPSTTTHVEKAGTSSTAADVDYSNALWWLHSSHVPEEELQDAAPDLVMEVCYPQMGFYKENASLDQDYAWNRRFQQIYNLGETEERRRDMQQFVFDFTQEAVPFAMDVLGHLDAAPSPIVHRHGITLELCGLMPLAKWMFDSDPFRAQKLCNREVQGRWMLMDAACPQLCVPYTILVEYLGYKAILYPRIPVKELAPHVPVVTPQHAPAPFRRKSRRASDALIPATASSTRHAVSFTGGGGGGALGRSMSAQANQSVRSSAVATIVVDPPAHSDAAADTQTHELMYGTPCVESFFQHTFHQDDAEVNAICQRVARMVKSKGHWIGREFDDKVFIFGPLETKLYRSRLDNRIYIRNVARYPASTIPYSPSLQQYATVEVDDPATGTANTNEYFTSLFRPEFVREHQRVELSSDSASPIAKVNTDREETDRLTNVKYLVEYLVPQAAGQLSRDIRLNGVTGFFFERGGLSRFLHSWGINMRYLAHVHRALVKIKHSGIALQHVETELVARALKQWALHEARCERTGLITIPRLERALRSVVIPFIAAPGFWDRTVLSSLSKKYELLQGCKWEPNRVVHDQVICRLGRLLGVTLHRVEVAKPHGELNQSVRTPRRGRSPKKAADILRTTVEPAFPAFVPISSTAADPAHPPGEATTAAAPLPASSAPVRRFDWVDSEATAQQVRIRAYPKVSVPLYPRAALAEGQDVHLMTIAKRYLREVAVDLKYNPISNKDMVQRYIDFLCQIGERNCEELRLFYIAEQERRDRVLKGAKPKMAEAGTNEFTLKYRLKDKRGMRLLDISRETLDLFRLYHMQRVQQTLGADAGVVSTIIGVLDGELFHHEDDADGATELVGRNHSEIQANYGMVVLDRLISAAKRNLTEWDGDAEPLLEAMIRLPYHQAGERGMLIFEANPDTVLAAYGVEPADRILFVDGARVGKTATILGLIDGVLYYHVDGAITADTQRPLAVTDATSPSASSHRLMLRGDKFRVLRPANGAGHIEVKYPIEPRSVYGDGFEIFAGYRSMVAYHFQYRQLVDFGSGPFSGERAVILGVGSGGVLYARRCEPNGGVIPLGKSHQEVMAEHSPEIAGILPYDPLCPTPPKGSRLAYRGIGGDLLVFDASFAACVPLGATRGQRIKILRGDYAGLCGIVVGAWKHQLWAQLVGERGALPLTPSSFVVLKGSMFHKDVSAAATQDDAVLLEAVFLPPQQPQQSSNAGSDPAQLTFPFLLMCGEVVSISGSPDCTNPFGFFHSQRFRADLSLLAAYDGTPTSAEDGEEEAALLLGTILGVFCDELWYILDAEPFARPFPTTNRWELEYTYQVKVIGLAPVVPWQDAFCGVASRMMPSQLDPLVEDAQIVLGYCLQGQLRVGVWQTDEAVQGVWKGWTVGSAIVRQDRVVTEFHADESAAADEASKMVTRHRPDGPQAIIVGAMNGLLYVRPRVPSQLASDEAFENITARDKSLPQFVPLTPAELTKWTPCPAWDDGAKPYLFVDSIAPTVVTPRAYAKRIGLLDEELAKTRGNGHFAYWWGYIVEEQIQLPTVVTDGADSASAVPSVASPRPDLRDALEHTLCIPGVELSVSAAVSPRDAFTAGGGGGLSMLTAGGADPLAGLGFVPPGPIIAGPVVS